MFAAVREKLVGAWRSLREGSLAKLFVFEFVVVMLGVLAAQWVSEWAEDRRLAREAEARFEQSVRSAETVYRVLDFWSEKGPCISERADAVARAASRGEPLARAAIGRPALPRSDMPEWDVELWQAGIKHIGQDRMDAIEAFENQDDTLHKVADSIRSAWATFALLDPEIGTPSEADLANVRLAAIQVSDYIRLLRFKATEPVEERALLGLESFNWDEFDYSEAPFDECGMILGWGE